MTNPTKPKTPPTSSTHKKLSSTTKKRSTRKSAPTSTKTKSTKSTSNKTSPILDSTITIPTANTTSAAKTTPPHSPTGHPITPDKQNPANHSSPAKTTTDSLLNDDIASFTTAATETTPVSTTSFSILLQVIHNPAISDRASVETLHGILTTTLAHHDDRLPTGTHLAIGSLKYRNTQRRSRPYSHQQAHYFFLKLIPASDADQFDPTISRANALLFVLQNWIVHNSPQFSISATFDHPELTNPDLKMPPSDHPMARDINLLLPALNGFHDSAKGCLVGISPERFGGKRRGQTMILQYLHAHIKPYLPTKPHNLADWFTFTDHIGIRDSYLQSNNTKSNLRCSIFFLCTFSDSIWQVLLSASLKAGPANIHGNLCIPSPFPLPVDRDNLIKNQNKITNSFKNMHLVRTDRLIINSPADEQKFLISTPNVCAISPCFVIHHDSPIMHNIYFKPTPDTIFITNETLDQAKAPPELIRPAAKTTFLQVAAKPATPTPANKTNQAAHHQALLTIFNQWADASPTIDLTSDTFVDVPTKRPRKRDSSHYDSDSKLTPGPPTPPPTPPPAQPLAEPPAITPHKSSNQYSALQDDAISVHSSTDNDDDDESSASVSTTSSSSSATDFDHTELCKQSLDDTNEASDPNNDEDPDDAHSIGYSTPTPSQHTARRAPMDTDSVSKASSSSDDEENEAMSATLLNSDDEDSSNHSHTQSVPPDPNRLTDDEIAAQLKYQLMQSAFPPHLSQVACSHFQQLHHHVSTCYPERLASFSDRFYESMHRNEDPAVLEAIIHSWSTDSTL
jgi:hypothetical protein